MSTTTRPSMTESEFKRLADIIYQRSGIHFPENKRYVLESRLGHRLAELEIDNYTQYIAFLTMGPYQTDEFQEMFNRITINETSFFRNEPQLEVFEKQVLPVLLDARARTKRLRIWSAACSSGEEPYTLAIMLERTLGVRLGDWRIEILATDISAKVLKAAQEGVYTNYALRSTSPLILQRYFQPMPAGAYRIRPDIAQMVRFEQHNLKDRLAARRHGTFDVIFCRNVMIYFDDGMKKQVAQMFSETLADDGYLFIGHSESLRGLNDTLEPTPIPRAFCYRKRGAELKKAA
ncbi:MAG: protein-glutamate O-methyltransferase CheR [Phycisphaerales bacterium]|nr:MAG: protein-glutamate O-methyltransferase CheR [Phycisphaerales bacterium]